MSRPPRIYPSGYHYHVIVRCNNQAFHLENDEDFSCYLTTLRFVQRKHVFKLFNYELMNSHVHLFIEPGHLLFSQTMQLINWKYAMDYNRRKKRRGHLWMDRYKCIPVESNEYALALMRYMNRNPIRAKMVEKVGEWNWSGYRFYAEGEENDLLTPHPTYMALRQTEEGRRREYGDFVNDKLAGEDQREPKFSDSLFIGGEDFGKRFKF